MSSSQTRRFLLRMNQERLFNHEQDPIDINNILRKINSFQRQRRYKGKATDRIVTSEGEGLSGTLESAKAVSRVRARKYSRRVSCEAKLSKSHGELWVGGESKEKAI